MGNRAANNDHNKMITKEIETETLFSPFPRERGKIAKKGMYVKRGLLALASVAAIVPLFANK